MPPEQVNGYMINGKEDIWSTGVILVELATGELAFSGEEDTRHNIIYKTPRKMPNSSVAL